ncbi:MerR family transcriptional regulator [Paenibacillus roseipurpureus]|uniref:MerR family transcriptional regulator n=1 Tax=Paenibacillus roseopurpureus TaxID=2918901 RepID=A0AA96LRK4_9BACL|nr:MerR family transcriptional regulator [Paenibacillus sp. MBLB1832]WNR44518.1 MerR family transcriptional regulator [Paenibacillus sp. MBLB1832]
MSQYIRIGLFSKIAQVTIRTLRHYDERGLLKPAYIDAATSYRYYTYDQLTRIHHIVVLKETGFSLDEIAVMIDQALTMDDMKRMMQKKKSELASQINEATQQMARIESRLHLLEQLGEKPAYEVGIKQVPALYVAGLRRIVPRPQDMPVYRCQMFEELEEALGESAIASAMQMEYVLYHMTEFIEENFDIEAAFCFPSTATLRPDGPVTLYEIPAEPLVASLVYKGPFMGVGDGILALFTWLGGNGYSQIGPVRELHLFGRENHLNDYNNVVVELQVPISK